MLGVNFCQILSLISQLHNLFFRINTQFLRLMSNYVSYLFKLSWSLNKYLSIPRRFLEPLVPYSRLSKIVSPESWITNLCCQNDVIKNTFIARLDYKSIFMVFDCLLLARNQKTARKIYVIPNELPQLFTFGQNRYLSCKTMFDSQITIHKSLI